MDAKTIFDNSKYKTKEINNMKTSDIKITVGLDENNVPEKLLWTAQDGGDRARRSKSNVIVCLG